MSDANPLSTVGPNGIYQRIVQAGESWAELNAAASILEETEKPTLARLTLERMHGGLKSRALAETEALASDEFFEHLQKMVDARKAANVASVRHRSALVWAEMVRSANANRRADLQASHLTP